MKKKTKLQIKYCRIQHKMLSKSSIDYKKTPLNMKLSLDIERIASFLSYKWFLSKAEEGWKWVIEKLCYAKEQWFNKQGLE